MILQISHGITIHVITHYRITHAVKFQIGFVRLGKFRIGLLYSKGDQGKNRFLINGLFLLKSSFDMRSDGTENTACSSNTHIPQRLSHCFFQHFLYFLYGLSHPVNIMDLSVQHGTGLMFLGALGNHNKPCTILVAYGSHNTPGSDVQTKYKLFLCFFIVGFSCCHLSVPQSPVNLFISVRK